MEKHINYNSVTFLQKSKVRPSFIEVYPTGGFFIPREGTTKIKIIKKSGSDNCITVNGKITSLHPNKPVEILVDGDIKVSREQKSNGVILISCFEDFIVPKSPLHNLFLTTLTNYTGINIGETITANIGAVIKSDLINFIETFPENAYIRKNDVTFTKDCTIISISMKDPVINFVEEKKEDFMPDNSVVSAQRKYLLGIIQNNGRYEIKFDASVSKTGKNNGFFQIAITNSANKEVYRTNLNAQSNSIFVVKDLEDSAPYKVWIDRTSKMARGDVFIKNSYIAQIDPMPLDLTSKYKVAVCFSGQFRSFNRCFPSIKRYLLDIYNPDIFIHTWDDNYIKHLNNHSKDLDIKAVKIEKPKTFKISELHEMRKVSLNRNLQNVFSMLYSIEKSNDLKTQHEVAEGFTYDYVFRLRSDLLFKSTPSLSQSEPDKLNTPFFGHFAGLNDQFAWGSSKVMNAYCGVYSRIDELLNNGSFIDPEPLVKDNIVSNNIQINKMPVEYVIQREDGKILNNRDFATSLGFKIDA